MHERSTDLRIPVVQEEVDIAKELVETGRLRIHTHVSERQEVVELPLSREEFTVERVAIGRPVDAPVEVRQDGDVTIVPVHEEEFVVTRRLVLKEELHIRRAVHRTVETHEVTLRRQDVDVSRAPPAPTDGPVPRY
ncbi:YsnF/AvaK domain-containing protein [Lysobacter humi (ex Lee et al. 2017)]